MMKTALLRDGFRAAACALAVMMGMAHAQFTDIGAGLTGVDISSVAWGDFDNDGLADILLTGMTAGNVRVSKVYRNNGDGSFTDIEAGLTGVSYSSAAWGDYNNNGRLDILLSGVDASFSPVTKVYENNGDGSFTDIGAGLTPVSEGSVAWGDYNGNGLLDILVTGFDAGFNPVAKVYANNGDGSFTDIGAELDAVGFSSAAWGDYNGNGLLDILLAGEDASFFFITKVYENNGDGSFTDIEADLTGVFLGSVAWGDYNGNELLDILVTGLDNDFNTVSKVYANNGDGSFTDIEAGLLGVADGGAAWGDYNNDGFPDILLTGWDGFGPVSVVYENNGDGSFTDIGAALTPVSSSSVAWGDYNNDGNLDILLTGFSTGGLVVAKVYENDLPPDPGSDPDPDPDPEDPEPTVEELLEELLDGVAALQEAGVLNRGNANAMTTQLGNVVRSHERGNLNAACSQLGGFVSLVQGQLNSGRLSPEDGGALIGAAADLGGLFGCW